MPTSLFYTVDNVVLKNQAFSEDAKAQSFEPVYVCRPCSAITLSKHVMVPSFVIHHRVVVTKDLVALLALIFDVRQVAPMHLARTMCQRVAAHAHVTDRHAAGFPYNRGLAVIPSSFIIDVGVVVALGFCRVVGGFATNLGLGGLAINLGLSGLAISLVQAAIVICGLLSRTTAIMAAVCLVKFHGVALFNSGLVRKEESSRNSYRQHLSAMCCLKGFPYQITYQASRDQCLPP